jgi:integrase
LQTRVAAGEYVAPTRLTFSEYADRWLETQTHRLRPSTRDGYEYHLRVHINPRFGRRRLQAITVDDVAALIGSMMEAGYAAWTIKGATVVLSRVMASAVRSRTIAANPVRQLDKTERPTAQRRELPRFDHDDVARLISATPSRYRTLVAVSVLTGLRQSESLGLTWADVDLKEGLLRVRRQLTRRGVLTEPKTEAAKRDIPIAPSLGTMLAAHREDAFRRGHAKTTDFVFASERGTPLGHRHIVRRGLDKALAAAALPHISWHSLRHIAASLYIAAGCDVAYLSALLGHANPSITLSIYAHAFAERDRAAEMRDRMEEAFAEVLR